MPAPKIVQQELASRGIDKARLRVSGGEIGANTAPEEEFDLVW